MLYLGADRKCWRYGGLRLNSVLLQSSGGPARPMDG
jgi:hypothetical protein